MNFFFFTVKHALATFLFSVLKNIIRMYAVGILNKKKLAIFYNNQ